MRFVRMIPFSFQPFGSGRLYIYIKGRCWIVMCNKKKIAGMVIIIIEASLNMFSWVPQGVMLHFILKKSVWIGIISVHHYVSQCIGGWKKESFKDHFGKSWWWKATGNEFLSRHAGKLTLEGHFPIWFTASFFLRNIIHSDTSVSTFEKY